jgi:CBS domain-containing protein
MKVSRILSAKKQNVITIGSEATVREALKMMTNHRIGALVVVEESRRLVGIVSERDILWRAAEDEDVFSLLVSEVMTRDVIAGVPQDSLMSVAHTMTERRFRHLPIVDRGELIGIVSIGDVLKAQRDAYEGEIDTLETQMLADEM